MLDVLQDVVGGAEARAHAAGQHHGDHLRAAAAAADVCDTHVRWQTNTGRVHFPNSGYRFGYCSYSVRIGKLYQLLFLV
jgi:hypothetical protein